MRVLVVEDEHKIAIIIVLYQKTARDGDRMVAIMEKGATLKVYRERNGKVHLEPRNKSLGNIYPKELEIRGKFCGLIRGAINNKDIVYNWYYL